MPLPHNAKGVKRERREAKLKHGTTEELPEEKKQKLDSE